MPAALATGALVLAPGGAGASSATVKVAFLQGEQVVYANRNGSTLRQAVAALLAGPTSAERGRELASAVPAGTPLRAVSVANGVATVDLGERSRSDVEESTSPVFPPPRPRVSVAVVLTFPFECFMEHAGWRLRKRARV